MKELSSEKNAKYQKIYKKNLKKYKNSKVKLDFLEVWVGKTCNLRCRDCLHMIPYIKQKKLEVSRLISDCKRLLELCSINYFSIAGGEPFCCKNLFELMDFVTESADIKDGKIVTNGTVVPEERTIDALRRMKGKLEIRVDVYPGQADKTAKFIKILEENEIRNHIQFYRGDKKSNWKHVSSPMQMKICESMSEMIYSDCTVRHCYTMCDGELTACPRGITTEEVFSLEKNPFEHVNIRELKNDVEARARIATCFEDSLYKDYCKYCLGLTAFNPYYVVPGVQVKSNEYEKFKI